MKGNTDKILQSIESAKEQSADIVVFSELVICGYPPEDLILLPGFMESVESELERIVKASSSLTVVVGTPRRNPDLKEKALYNSAAIIHNQQLLGFQDKFLLPTYDVFDERRYFEPANFLKIWNIAGKRVGITICEDIWQHSQLVKYTSYSQDPIEDLINQKPDLVLNLSASPFSFSKFQKRLKVSSLAAASLNCPLILCNQVGGNDSLIFDGYSHYLNSKGELLKFAKGFEEDQLFIDLETPILPLNCKPEPLEDLYRALVLGVRDYFHKSGFTKACLGLSGGIDSALVACIAAKALGPENVLAISMPSRYSSEGSLLDAQKIVKTLGIKYREISIESPFEAFLDLLAPQFEGHAQDVTEENLQARIRGVILMALSNKLGYIVLSTGNKSELAMGYSTLYGDTCGGVGVISDVTKMQVYGLAHWINRESEIIPWDTIKKPPSAELSYNQKDQDTLPEYSILDNILEAYIERHRSAKQIEEEFHYPLKEIEDVIRKIHRNEYKRRQNPPGLRVTEKAFSAGRRFPIVERWI